MIELGMQWFKVDLKIIVIFLTGIVWNLGKDA